MESETPKEGQFRFEVPADGAGSRLDVFLSRTACRSRTQVQKLIKSGAVTVCGRRSRSGAKLEQGQTIEGTLPAIECFSPEAEDIPLQILFEDGSVAALNKPAGMPTQATPHERSVTVVNALLWRYKGLSLFRQELQPGLAGIVHRLDRDTSGVLLAALDEKSGENLQAQFRARTIAKEYVAVVHGVVEFDEGEITAPIGRDQRRFDRRRVDARSGKDAATAYRVLERFEGFTLLRCMPRTGRTHQIRVHLQHLGYAVAGDAAYPPKSRPKEQVIGRQALHASRISFDHPEDGRRLTIQAPLPADMAELIGRLREGR